MPFCVSVLPARAGDLSIKAGHFFTLIGYEVVGATGNFFYSHAFTMNNSEPFTHTGVLGTYDLGDGYTSYFGWTPSAGSRSGDVMGTMVMLIFSARGARFVLRSRRFDVDQ